MIKVCKRNNESVLRKLKNGHLDYAHISSSNTVDDIISTMNEEGILQCLADGMDDIRARNRSIPQKLIHAFFLAAKMRQKMSLTDIPTAITDHRLLGDLGYNLVDTDGKLGSSLMTESGLRYIIDKHDPFELFKSYNRTVQEHIMPKLSLVPTIHIADCTKIEVSLNNSNYEWSSIGMNKDGHAARGYKLAILRGIAYDTGFIEDVRFGQIHTNDLELSREMIMTSPALKPGHILICDRGYIDRELINYLKIYRGVSVYQPLRCDMIAYKDAVAIAKSEHNWKSHPNKNRTSQKSAFVPHIGQQWFKEGKNDVELNACVVWDQATGEYFVFVTSELGKSAREIIKTYELRPEIEEQFRQIKAWGLEKFTCTKMNTISFHLVFTLLAYLLYELYTMMPDGEEYAHKSLPTINKNYITKSLEYVILYSDNEFAIILLTELLDIYAICESEVREKIKVAISQR